MNGPLAGIFDPASRRSQRESVAAALAPERGESISVVGPLTVASAGASEPEPAPVGVCLLDGYLSNLAQIRNSLGLPPSASTRHSLTELVRRRGTGAVAELRGAFVVVVWDQAAARGVVATDHLGAGGLFFQSDGRRLLFGSEIRTVLNLLQQAPAPDEDALTQWLANDVPAAGKTLYEGVSRLRGGHMIELLPDSWHLRRYWRPRYTGTSQLTSQECEDAVRLAASAAVKARLDPGGTGILLSGGLDSSSVAAFARSGGIDASIRAYSAVFPDHPETDESQLIELVAGSLDLPLTKIAVRGGSMLGPALDYLAAWRLPSISPNLLFMTPLARAAEEGGSKVLLDGEGGDELFGGSPYVFADLLMRARVGSALRLTKSIPGIAEQPRARALRWIVREWGAKGAVPYFVHPVARRLRPGHYGPRWLTPAAARRHVRNDERWAWKRLHGPRWWASLAFELTEGRERFGAHDFLRHKSALAGVAGRHPYFEDLDLVERMLSIPPEASFDPNLDRPLLRRAVKGRLPDEVRLRRGKSSFNPLFHHALTSTDRHALLRLLDDRARVARHVQVDEIRSYLLGASSRPAAWAWLVWRVAAAECWLRSLEDASFPERSVAEWRLEPPRLGPVHTDKRSSSRVPVAD